ILAVSASACVVENDPIDGDLADVYDEIEGDEEGLDEGEAAAPGLDVAFWPDQCEQGEDFLGYVTVIEGDPADFEVADIKVYGDAEVNAWDQRNGELIVSASVPANAVEGDVDIVIELADGSAVWIESATTVYQRDSGGSAAEAGDSPYERSEGDSSSDASGGGGDESDCD
ncbi:MAG: hypothetical protein GY884_07990, partial [Proteobacteria bacterium]|nr:hypothetical protein [Pseudomonadota bacterium]